MLGHVKLDPLQAAPREPQWSNICDLPLEGDRTLLVGVLLNVYTIAGELDARLGRDPVTHIPQRDFDGIRAQRLSSPHGEIKVFRKAIRLEEALLETGSAFEDPRDRRRWAAMPYNIQPST
jgi:hypothetical protein